MTDSDNRDRAVVEGFGREWAAFDQSGVDPEEHRDLFEQYFSVFPWNELTASAVGADIGCGSGRWAALVAPRVGRLHCVDASPEALAVARRNLTGVTSVEFHERGVDDLPFAVGSLDFAYSLGVLHHVPDTQAALADCARVLRPGAPFLVYLYYAFDNQPGWYRWMWRGTDVVRRALSRLPFVVRLVLTTVIALFVYLPLAMAARLLEAMGRDVSSFPLSYYRRRSLYIMRNDALDRFGTRLERRFTREQIREMLEAAGFIDVVFSAGPPYWTALARRRSD